MPDGSLKRATLPSQPVPAPGRQPTRDAILDAAADLFIEKGYAGTSLRDVADRAGIGRTALYHHFRNKEEILSLLVDGVTISFERATAAIAQRHDLSATDALTGVVRAYMAGLVANPRRFRVVERLESGLPPAMRSIHVAAKRRIFQNVASVIRRGVEVGDFRPVDPSVTALALLGVCNWAGWWYRPAAGRLAGEELLAFATEFACSALVRPGEEPAESLEDGGPLASFAALRSNLDRLQQFLTGYGEEPSG